MEPPAPGLLSTMTGWPSRSPSLSASSRAGMSVEPPAAPGTTRVMGRVGQASAAMAAVAHSQAAAASVRRLNMVFLLRACAGPGRLSARTHPNGTVQANRLAIEHGVLQDVQRGQRVLGRVAQACRGGQRGGPPPHGCVAAPPPQTAGHNTPPPNRTPRTLAVPTTCPAHSDT